MSPATKIIANIYWIILFLYIHHIFKYRLSINNIEYIDLMLNIYKYRKLLSNPHISPT